MSICFVKTLAKDPVLNPLIGDLGSPNGFYKFCNPIKPTDFFIRALFLKKKLLTKPVGSDSIFTYTAWIHNWTETEGDFMINSLLNCVQKVFLLRGEVRWRK